MGAGFLTCLSMVGIAYAKEFGMVIADKFYESSQEAVILLLLLLLTSIGTYSICLDSLLFYCCRCIIILFFGFYIECSTSHLSCPHFRCASFVATRICKCLECSYE